jgi:hypothetical protein
MDLEEEEMRQSLQSVTDAKKGLLKLKIYNRKHN